jgi:hypothetical protein
MKDAVERLLAECPGARPEFFEASGWLSDESGDSIESIIDEYERHFCRRLDALKPLLGEPDRTEITHRDEIGQWYPEAIRAACWFQQGKILCLVLEHQ